MTTARSELYHRSGDDDRARPWALFLDLDGTLVDIADRPDAVRAEAALPSVLEGLRENLDGALALVSGRSLAALDLILAPFRGDAAGIHGTEWRYRGEHHLVPAEFDDALRSVVCELRAELGDIDGVIVEDKRGSVAVHWRMAPRHEDNVRAAVTRCLDRLGRGFRCQSGKAVLEILPAGADKGRAVSHFLTLQPYCGRRPIYAGDDLTDEAAFAVVQAAGGVSIRIGCQRHAATDLCMDDPREFRRWLTQWATTGSIPLH